jgi:hypothetical protein
MHVYEKPDGIPAWFLGFIDLRELLLKLCQRGEWQDRMLVETVLSLLTLITHFKRVMHRVWAYFQARLAFTMAAFNVLVQWHGFQPYASGFVPLSIAEFSL